MGQWGYSQNAGVLVDASHVGSGGTQKRPVSSEYSNTCNVKTPEESRRSHYGTTSHRTLQSHQGPYCLQWTLNSLPPLWQHTIKRTTHTTWMWPNSKNSVTSSTKQIPRLPSFCLWTYSSVSDHWITERGWILSLDMTSLWKWDYKC